MIRAGVVLGLVLSVGCTSTADLIAEGRYPEALQSFETDPGRAPESPQLAKAITGELDVELTLVPLSDEELFGLLGSVPREFAAGEAVLLYQHVVARRKAKSDQVLVEVTARGLPRDRAKAIVPPPEPIESSSSSRGGLIGLAQSIGRAVIGATGSRSLKALSKLSRGWRVRSAGSSTARGPESLQRHEAREALAGLPDADWRSPVGFVLLGYDAVEEWETRDETVELTADVYVQYKQVTWEHSPPQPVTAPLPGTGPLRDRFAALCADGPLTLTPDGDGFRWTVDPKRAAGRAQVEVARAAAVREQIKPHHYIERGQLRALADQRKEARDDFLFLCDLEPDEPFNAIWLALVGGGTERLERFSEGDDWWRHLARLVLGRETPEQVLAEAEEAINDNKRIERRCEAHGYLGMLADRRGDADAAKTHYEASVATGVESFYEHFWARARLRQMSEAAEAR